MAAEHADGHRPLTQRIRLTVSNETRVPAAVSGRLSGDLAIFRTELSCGRAFSGPGRDVAARTPRPRTSWHTVAAPRGSGFPCLPRPPLH